MRLKSCLLLILSGFLLLSSCGKENIDTSEMSDDFETTTVRCPLQGIITQIPIGTFNANIFGGTEPYQYQWSNGNTTRSFTLTDPPSGNYTVTVTDADGCTLELTTAFSTNDCPDLGVSIERIGDEVFATATGGATPYTFYWSNGETVTDVSEHSIRLSAENEAISLTVVDATGCDAIDAVNVCPFISRSISSPGPGTLTSSPILGSGSYTFDWSTGLSESGESSTIFTETSVVYTITITDNITGCVQTQEFDACINYSVTINEIPANSGNLIVNVINGTAPFMYEWSTAETTEGISVMDSGTYSITVTDENGCVSVDSIIL